ncbi:MAG: KamA family radical SAM protein [Syntrophorhabdus aromaticivorans]|uniref:KamA family radical SAM protein n=1 Tax=Syntrophorhabdus aromaticivorans TaxID=328301 RepID=A0A971S0X4_9BACT|nr:KamA family radical SAM protein [Syntrophorhabdus aromaticivorans]
MGEEQKGSFRTATLELLKKKEGRLTTLPFITRVADLANHLSLSKQSKSEIDRVSRVFPFRIPEFYLQLMDKGNPVCPIRMQSLPSLEELEGTGETDPLGEQRISITPSFLKKYPGRGVFLAGARCAMYCRFCNRRRLVGRQWNPKLSWEESFLQMERQADLKEIIVSGGDPFMLPVCDFAYVMERLRAINRIRIVRVSTRIPVVYPEGLLEGQLKALSGMPSLWIVIHINHPREISPEFIDAVRRLKGIGANMLSQTVLLRRVNDCARILRNLFETLVSLGIKPYYLFQLDEVAGAGHFKVRIEEGIRIMRHLRENCSGLAIPHYALDITGGLGKIPLDYRYIKGRKGEEVHVESPAGVAGMYTDNGKKSECASCGICKG